MKKINLELIVEDNISIDHIMNILMDNMMKYEFVNYPNKRFYFEYADNNSYVMKEAVNDN